MSDNGNGNGKGQFLSLGKWVALGFVIVLGIMFIVIFATAHTTCTEEVITIGNGTQIIICTPNAQYEITGDIGVDNFSSIFFGFVISGGALLGIVITERVTATADRRALLRMEMMIRDRELNLLEAGKLTAQDLTQPEKKEAG